MVVALAAIVAAIVAGRQAGWPRVVPVILGGGLLAGASLLLIGWISITHLQICFPP